MKNDDTMATTNENKSRTPTPSLIPISPSLNPSTASADKEAGKKSTAPMNAFATLGSPHGFLIPFWSFIVQRCESSSRILHTLEYYEFIIGIMERVQHLLCECERVLMASSTAANGDSTNNFNGFNSNATLNYALGVGSRRASSAQPVLTRHYIYGLPTPT